MIWLRARNYAVSKLVDGLIWIAYRLNRRHARLANLQQERPVRARITVPPRTKR